MEKADYFFWRIGIKGWIVLVLMSIIFIFGMLFVGSTMYAGNTYTYDTDIESLRWEVEGNASNLEGLTITHENNQIILDFVINFKPDNFILTFYDNTTQEEVVNYNTGGSNGNWSFGYITYAIIPNKTMEEEPESEPIPPIEEEVENKISFVLFVILICVIFFIILILVGWALSKLLSLEETFEDYSPPEFENIQEDKTERREEHE